ncbi:U3 small nucleolar RNA-associated protein 18 homolog [Pteropus vampyrus]|uniref:U3 small nucleolar RNA-associated protein 18 homolog n=1 Tax=Pteropus vampyrus TaxID=132908 RepID=A0A6P6CPB2_PTEVA|nr:U3 small nucleolar RNA-associated protein 18 homolog [Pteropus vampyrus]
MPPERGSRTRPDRRTRAKPNRKTRMKPDRRARAGPGGPPRKAAPSSQRKPPARPRAAAAAIAVAAEEERRLRQRNRLTLEEDKPAVEQCLEELIFGDVEDSEDALLQRLRGPLVQVQEDSGDSEVENEARGDFPPQKKPVWVDEEDEDEEMIDMVNNRFRKNMMKNACESKLSKDELQKRLKEEFQHAMGGVPAWVETNKRKTSSGDESEEEEDDLLQRTGNFISTSASLPKGILKIKNCQHANAERPTAARISSVQFHPCAQVVMVAGLDNSVSLFQVDGKTNPKIQSIYLEKFPVFKACFSANGEEVLATSTHSKVLYVYDMLAGKLIPVHQVRGKVSLEHKAGQPHLPPPPTHNESEEEEDDLLQRTGNFISTSASLPKGILKIKNCQHANAERPTAARISSVQFHPCAQVVMVAGLDNSVSLFQVDGKTNPKIQSIYLEKFPVFKACFSANGEEVLATSTHSKVLYVYDMLAGKLIPVHQVRDPFLTFHSADGEVYVWDVNSRKCLNRFVDEGSLYGLSIATSRNGQYVACGSNCGVVNIYNQDSCLQETNPKPIKAIMNLVTGVTSLTFNPTTEILAIASEKMKEAVRLVHLPSCTVFSNFPVIKKKNISLVHTMDFSPRSGYFALGNEKGKALMYRLHHYSDF